MKWMFLTLIAGAAGLLWWSGALAYLTDMGWVKAQVEAAGWLGPFLLLFLALFPFFAAGPLVWLSAAIWPAYLAILYSSVASVLCSWVFFVLARKLGQDWARKKIPEKVWEYESRLETHPWGTIIVLRVLLWVNPAVDAFIGISGISARTYLVASAVAFVPYTAGHVLVVIYGFELLKQLPVWVYALLLLSIAGAAFLVRRRKTGQAANQ